MSQDTIKYGMILNQVFLFVAVYLFAKKTNRFSLSVKLNLCLCIFLVIFVMVYM